MLYNRFFYIAIIALGSLNSCYHKELHYSFDASYGGVNSGASCYYLAHIREFQRPKGITTFPDGGLSRDVRQLFGLFKTDTLSNSTILIAGLGNVVGWPSSYSTRLVKNDSHIAIGIVNVTQPDSISGIYLYNISTGKLEKYSKQSALPTLSQNGSLMAYCVINRLVIDDYSSRTTLYSYLLNFEPVFVSWKSDNELYLFLSNPFSVKVLNTATGKTTDSDLKYIKNYDQAVDITTILRVFRGSKLEPREILDKYY
jgi:hypothetical protein